MQHTTRLSSWIAATGAALAATAASADLAPIPATGDDVRAIVTEMLADAESRSSLLQSGGTAGHDGAFFMASPDGDFKLQIKGFLQFRYTLNFRDGNTIGDDFTPGFSNARSVMFFKGNIFDPDLTYQVRITFARAGGAASLDDAWFAYKINDNWSTRAGQGLWAFDREWYHGDVKLQAIERSMLGLMFGGVRAQFAELKYQNDDIRTIFTFSDGLRSLNTDFGASPADFAVTLRGEWKVDGDWKTVIGPVTSPRGSDGGFALGGAIHYELGADTGAPGAVQQELIAWTADLNYKADGWNILASGTGYHTTDEAGVAGADYDEYGFMLQGGVYVADDVEVFGRYSVIMPDSSRAASDDFNTLTLGMNYYIHGHALRFTVQGQLFLDPTTNTVAGNFANTGGRNPTSSLFGVLADDEDNQFTLSAQLQLLF